MRSAPTPIGSGEMSMGRFPSRSGEPDRSISQPNWQWRTDMLMLDRRMLLRAGSAALGAAALAPTAPAFARAPQVGKQAQPGFYRFKLGTIEITVVSDGLLAFPADM